MLEDQDYGYSTGDLFADEQADGFYPPTPPPTQQTYTMRSGRKVTLHLVGASPTEAHHVWNGARAVADYLETGGERVRGRTVLELGAASGLPSLVAAILGARRVVMTDFPDPDLVENMQRNIDECGDDDDDDAQDDESVVGSLGGGDGEDCRLQQQRQRRRIAEIVEATGFVWGADVAPLLARLSKPLPTTGTGTETRMMTTVGGKEGEEQVDADQGEQEQEKKNMQINNNNNNKFDVLILADLLFRHNEHGMLVKTIKEALAPTRSSVAYVFFTSYRPWKQDLDWAFFDVAREAGLEVTHVETRKLDRPLFDNDPGDLDVQRTVYGFEIRWPCLNEEK